MIVLKTSIHYAYASMTESISTDFKWHAYHNRTLCAYLSTANRTALRCWVLANLTQ